jgi:hypothetical protein
MKPPIEDITQARVTGGKDKSFTVNTEKKTVPMGAIVVEYRFELEEDQIDAFRIEIDPESLLLRDCESAPAPEWTRLENHQCPNCPLDPCREPRCPAAVNMVGLLGRFDHLLSHDETTVSVVTGERCLSSRTTVQRAVCSLMGLLMATSGCPLTAFFKPMARFHLPFASTDETIWRATTTYLLAQHFLYQEGISPDLGFAGLSKLYAQIEVVNLAFAKRLRTACQCDSMVNAIILLDMFAKSMPWAIDESLEAMRHLFLPYLDYVDSAESDGRHRRPEP